MRHGPVPIGHRAGERRLGRVVDRKAQSRNPTDSAKKLNGGSRMVASIAPAKSAEKPASEELTDRGRAGDVMTGQKLPPCLALPSFPAKSLILLRRITVSCLSPRRSWTMFAFRRLASKSPQATGPANNSDPIPLRVCERIHHQAANLGVSRSNPFR
jgi:hypothetical protein